MLYSLLVPSGKAVVCVMTAKDGTKWNRATRKRFSIGTEVKGQLRRLTHKQRETHMEQHRKIEKEKKKFGLILMDF